MATVAMQGRLNMLTATIDWRDETVRCVGVFRSEDAGAFEVEYRIHLDDATLDFLAKSFLKAGVPVLRGSDASTPAIALKGETLAEYVPADPPVKRFGMSGERLSEGTRVDRRRKEFAHLRKIPGAGNGTGEKLTPQSG